jgi:3-demethylubiquinone-9 3-methyltransferase
MAKITQKITPCLWFDSQAEEAAKFYTSIFKNSKIEATTYYDEESSKAAGRPKGSVLTVDFQLEGQSFMALNGGPVFKFTEAVSFVVNCENQKDRLLLGEAQGRRPGNRVRVAERQVRPVLAGGSHGHDGDAEGQGCPEVAASHGCDAQDEEARHRRARAGLSRQAGLTSAEPCSPAFWRANCSLVRPNIPVGPEHPLTDGLSARYPGGGGRESGRSELVRATAGAPKRRRQMAGAGA